MQAYYKKVFKLAKLAGQILMESNAEEYRVEDTTLRILQTTGLDSPASYSNTTGLFLSLTDSQLEDYNYSDIVRIQSRRNNIQHIAKVNDISRSYVAGELSVDQAYDELKNIPPDDYRPWVKYSNGALIVLFVILFGGNLFDIIVASSVSMAIIALESWRKTIYLTDFFFNIISIAVGSFLIKWVDASLPSTIHPSLLLGAIIIPAYPVTSTTNAMRDILKGNNLAGIIKGLDAAMIIISLTIGYTLGFLFSHLLLPFLT